MLIITIKKKKKRSLIFKNSKTLLDFFKKKKIEINYQCKMGFCGFCKVVLKKGKILYFADAPIAYLKKKEICSCCCIPISDITIQI